MPVLDLVVVTKIEGVDLIDDRQNVKANGKPVKFWKRVDPACCPTVYIRRATLEESFYSLSHAYGEQADENGEFSIHCIMLDQDTGQEFGSTMSERGCRLIHKSLKKLPLGSTVWSDRVNTVFIHEYNEPIVADRKHQELITAMGTM